MPQTVVPIERCGNLDTVVIDALDLEAGQYVLLRDDFLDDPDTPLLMSAAYVQPVIWRCAGWPEDDGRTCVLLLDAPDSEYTEIEIEYQTSPMIRLILDGQTHQRWDGQMASIR